ncbi:MAG: response regulator [Marinilabiliaceae bacterium]|nr:response regulator [Marinilabiliaceae bacterium]
MELSRKYQILIVDDHKDFVKALDYQIQDILGDKVQCIDYAFNGQEALDMVAGHPTYDIVFMDIDMPVMNGVDATRKLNHDYPHIRVVALSFHKEFEYVEQIIRAGARSYIVKSELGEKSIKRAFNL